MRPNSLLACLVAALVFCGCATSKDSRASFGDPTADREVLRQAATKAVERIGGELAPRIAQRLREEILLGDGVENFVDTRHGLYDRIRISLTEEERRKFFLKRYVIVPAVVSLYLLEFADRVTMIELEEYSKRLDALSTCGSIATLTNAVGRSSATGGLFAEPRRAKGKAEALLAFLDSSIPTLVPGGILSLGETKRREAQSLRTALQNEFWRQANAEKRSQFARVMEECSTNCVDSAFPSAAARDLARLQIEIACAKLRARANSVKVFNELVQSRMTFDRLEDWVSEFYGPFDLVKVTWHDYVRGDVAEKIQAEFESKVFSQSEFAQRIDQVAAMYGASLAAAVTDFRSAAELEYPFGSQPITTKSTPSPLEVPEVTNDPILKVIDLIDLGNLAALGASLVVGTEAAPATGGASLLLPIVVAIGQGAWQASRQASVVEAARAQVQELPFRTLYGSPSGAFMQAERELDRVFEGLENQIRTRRP